jgi:organic hydroperoxide reductase OsmC/OhrA
MTANPRRIGEIVCKFHFPGTHSEHDRKLIEGMAHGCPVAKSLHPDIKQTLTFHYEGAK